MRDAQTPLHATTIRKPRKTTGPAWKTTSVESVAVTEQAAPAARIPRPAIMMNRPPLMMDRASSRRMTLPCDCDAEGAIDVVLSAEESSQPYTFSAEGTPESLDISLEWTNLDGGGWPADLAISITGPDGGCVAIGGFNASPSRMYEPRQIMAFGRPIGR